MFERHAPRKSRPHVDFRDLAVFDLVEQRHQSGDFSTKREVGGGYFFARLCLNIQPYVYKNARGRAIPNRFTVLDNLIADIGCVTSKGES